MISARAPGQETCKTIVKKSIGILMFFIVKCLQTQCVWYDFDINARVCTLWYFLQWIIAVDDRTSMLRGKNKKNVDFVLFFTG